jgi:hypothetical protein
VFLIIIDMKKVISASIFIVLISISFLSGQDQNQVTINPANPAFREKFSHLNFDGKFYILAVKDAVNNYYMADFTDFADRFERIYFINLVYKSGKIVNIDSDLSQPRVWFLVNNKFTQKEAADEFDLLKEKTLKASASLSAEQKAKWLRENDKFSK